MRHGCRVGAGKQFRWPRERAPSGQRLVLVGAIRQRAAVGHGSRGLTADGEAWDYLPHDQARSRAYRWGEDGLAGLLRHRAAAVPGPGAVERAGPDPEGARLRADRGRGATTARTSRSTGGTSMPCPATPGTGGATTTRRVRTPTRICSPGKRHDGPSSSRSTSCSTPVRSTGTATGSSRCTTPRPTPTTF